MMGDFNAKVGKELGLAPNVRKYSLHEETNNNGFCYNKEYGNK